MDDNTAGLLLLVSLIAALVVCYVTSKVTDYLEERTRCQCAERSQDGVAS